MPRGERNGLHRGRGIKTRERDTDLTELFEHSTSGSLFAGMEFARK
jgi:hypothetical protein